ALRVRIGGSRNCSQTCRLKRHLWNGAGSPISAPTRDPGRSRRFERGSGHVEGRTAVLRADAPILDELPPVAPCDATEQSIGTSSVFSHMKKILFVEDDLMIIRIYRGSFQMEGYEVEVATDGEAALHCLQKNIPDAVVLDLQLPKVNGVEVLKNIR